MSKAFYFYSFYYIMIAFHNIKAISAEKQEDTETAEEIKENDLNSLKFRENKPTFVIVDGFLSNFFANMTQNTKDGIIRFRPNSNVIVVDWSKLSGWEKLSLDENVPLSQLMIVYDETKSKTDFVGQRLAQLLNNLVLQNLTNYSKMHLIGYSLGAHMGVAGTKVRKNYNGKIPRITGLDPAGPGFPLQKRDKRIDATDAEFVDVYFTSRFTTGDFEHNVGHVDVFVNGGRKQPGCDFPDIISSTICNHSYAWKMWNKCLHDKCIACPCRVKECTNGSGVCSDSSGIQAGINISMDISGDYYLKMEPL